MCKCTFFYRMYFMTCLSLIKMLYIYFITAMACYDTVQPVNKVIAKAMFSTLGSVCEEVPEYLMNPIGALSGSGPAFVSLEVVGFVF